MQVLRVSDFVRVECGYYEAIAMFTANTRKLTFEPHVLAMTGFCVLILSLEAVQCKG